MNEPTRTMIAASLDESAAAQETEEGRKRSVDEAVELATRLLRDAGRAGFPDHPTGTHLN